MATLYALVRTLQVLAQAAQGKGGTNQGNSPQNKAETIASVSFVACTLSRQW
jgi:hypothetical protein